MELKSKVILAEVGCVWAVAFTRTSDPHNIIKALNIHNEQHDRLNIQLHPAATLSLSLFRVRRAFFNEEGFDFIGLWMDNTELSPATFVHLIEQIMRRLCSWH